MSDEFRRELENLVENMKFEVDVLIRKVDELINRGDAHKAYKVWAEGSIEILKKIRESLEKLETHAKELELPESVIRDSLSYLRRELIGILAKIEEVASRLRSYRGRSFVLYLPTADKTFRDVISSIGESVEDIAKSVNRLAESLQEALSRSFSRITQVVSVRLREKDLEVIDQLVEAGIFGSRSEAVTYFARRGLESSGEWINKALEQAKKIRELQESIRKELAEKEEEFK